MSLFNPSRTPTPDTFPFDRDTLAVSLSYSFYHLAKHQHYQSHLYNQIAPLFGRTIPGELSDSDLLSIELLDAIINETLRLDNPNSNNAPRRTPPEGITVDNMWIPGGCSVRVPGYALQRSQYLHPGSLG